MIRIGIIGGAGYTAGELLRLLIFHPEAEVVFVHSKSNAGKPVSTIHEGLFGDTDLIFADSAPFDRIDLLFLCMGHGESTQFMKENKDNLPQSLKIIDLANDFRLRSDAGEFIYGLTDLNQDRIRQGKYIANPGCFATCIQLALLPLAAKGWLNDPIHITAITGSTGAGQKPSATSHFSWRDNNLSIYKPFTHQHLPEIKESLSQLQPSFDQPLYFVPIRGDFPRGIFASLYMNCDKDIEQIQEVFCSFYKDSSFVHIYPHRVDLKQVVNTNKGLIQVEKHQNQLLITSVIDNLLKGAAGQAVENMNLMFGKSIHCGLSLKPSGF